MVWNVAKSREQYSSSLQRLAIGQNTKGMMIRVIKTAYLGLCKFLTVIHFHIIFFRIYKKCKPSSKQKLNLILVNDIFSFHKQIVNIY